MGQPAMQLSPLVCPQCGGPVPLVDAESVACPYCQANVPVSTDYRDLRRARATLTAEQETATELYQRLGAVPPAWVKRFQLFETPVFWLGLAAFWLTGACAVGTVITMIANLFLTDPMTDRTQSAIIVGLAIESLWLGLVLAGWSHKRMVSRAGLQAALMSSPPSSPGGPARCRHCGAALNLAPGALGARCDYCGSDNLVGISPAWIDATKNVEKSLINEERSALVAEAEASSELAWSLFWRLFVCVFWLWVPLGIYFGSDLG